MTKHFAYGSNLWFEQMDYRCPQNAKVGIGLLEDFKWIISERGYANIVESKGDYVLGFVFTISESDEDALDGYEGVSWGSYTKEKQWIKGSDGKRKKCMLYIDRVRPDEGDPKEEYIARINKGVNDVLNFKPQHPQKRTKAYVRKYIRKFIPKPS